MSRVINNIKLFVKDNNKSNEIASVIKEKLIKKGFSFNENNYDLAISIGGDGTFLKMISETNFDNVYYIGINSGNLGFLEDISIDNIDHFIDCLNNNQLNIEELSYGNVSLVHDGIETNISFINEVVIRNNNYKTLVLPININNSYLEEFHGDGILVSTPIGSTAYNLSNNGPIIYNNLDVLILTPIAPINNRVYKTLSNSLVISKTKEINLIPKNDSSLVIVIDGKEKLIDNVSKINIKLSNNKIKVLRMKDYNFINVVNDKLIK